MKQMRNFIHNLSIRSKIITMVVVTSTSILIIAFSVYGYLSWKEVQKTVLESVTTLTGTIAVNSTAALAFNDRESAMEILGALSNAPEVISACLFTNRGEELGLYRSEQAAYQPLIEKFEKENPVVHHPNQTPAPQTTQAPPSNLVFHEDYLAIAQEVWLDNRKLGLLVVQVSLGRLQQAALRALLLSLTIIIASACVALLSAIFLERLISRPILNLVRLMSKVSKEKDYSLRARHHSEDEIGSLIIGFNDMLGQVEERDRALGQAINELETAKKKAEDANRAKSEFLATMSHEIRTPMSAVLGMTALALQSATDETQIRHLHSARNSGKTLLNVINDILDFSKIEAGKLSLENIDFNLDEVLDDTVAILSPQATEKGLRFSLEKLGQTPGWLKGDPTRLKQILFNLLGNGIKFTQQGGIKLQISAREEQHDSVQLEFIISDTGIGIAENQIDSIFEAFNQADGSTTRNFGGTGLGLSVSNRLAKLMGGQLKATSTLGEGSTFSFPCRFSIGAEPPSTEDNTEPQTPHIKNGNLLVVEDDKTNALLAQEVLLHAGYNVDLATNGEKAVEAYQRNNYDLILMDIQMPVMDGVAATQAIRKLEAKSGKSTPIVALTANVVTSNKEQLVARGMNDFLSKPYDMGQLLGIVSLWIGK